MPCPRQSPSGLPTAGHKSGLSGILLALALGYCQPRSSCCSALWFGVLIVGHAAIPGALFTCRDPAAALGICRGQPCLALGCLAGGKARTSPASRADFLARPGPSAGAWTCISSSLESNPGCAADRSLAAPVRSSCLLTTPITKLIRRYCASCVGRRLCWS